MDDAILAQIQQHAAAEYPKECCGFVIDQGNNVFCVVKCVNLYPDLPLDDKTPKNPVKSSRNSFLISTLDEIEASKRGNIIAVYHSHPDGKAEMSAGDILASEETCYPYLVVQCPGGGWASYAPKGFECKLVGRPFIYAVYDCFTLVRDYHRAEYGIVLDPAIYKQFGWWMSNREEDFYTSSLLKLGFEYTDELQKGTVVLMHYPSSAKAPNHLGMFNGDGFMLHHLSARPSELVPYGGIWEKNTRRLFRHKDLK